MKFAYPVFSFLISVLFQLCFLFAEGGTAFFFVWVISYLPLTSFLYSKKYLKEGKRSILYTLIHSFLLAFSYLIFFNSDSGAYGWTFILFVWCEVWALLGLIRKEMVPILFMRKKHCP